MFTSKNCKNYSKVENLYKFLLAEKNSFIFESVEKGSIRGRYTIIGLNPDKIWNINNNSVTLNKDGRKIKIKTNPLKFLNKLIENFKVKNSNSITFDGINVSGILFLRYYSLY